MPTPQERLLGESYPRLKAARVLVVGLGGLGCPAAQYLARTVGTLGLSDFDVVSESNLDRQILYSRRDVGHPKVDVASRQLAWLTNIQLHPTGLTGENALDQVSRYDLVLDCTDDLATRYLLDKACSDARVPWIHGALSTWGGHAMLLGDNARYSDWFPTPPEDPPNCADGVLSGACGLVGTLQATIAMTYLTGKRAPFGALHVVDALDGTIRIVTK